MKRFIPRLVPVLPFLFAASPAMAHSAAGTGGFESGLMHPWSGVDHMLAMLAVGIWGAVMGGKAVWKLPVTFPLVMVVGGVAGMALGTSYSFVELGVAISSFALGACVLFLWKPREWIALIPIVIFALLHGYAHGVELPDAANPGLYAAGFVISTGLIHVLGIFIGLGAMRLPHSALVIRAIGTVIAGAGIWLGAAWL